jgi:hypothetical protein
VVVVVVVVVMMMMMMMMMIGNGCLEIHKISSRPPTCYHCAIKTEHIITLQNFHYINRTYPDNNVSHFTAELKALHSLSL